MAEKWIVCFQSKNVKIRRIFISNNNFYIYLKRHFEKSVTNIFSVFSSTAALICNSILYVD